MRYIVAGQQNYDIYANLAEFPHTKALLYRKVNRLFFEHTVVLYMNYVLVPADKAANLTTVLYEYS